MPPNRLALWPGMHLQIKKPGAPAVPLQVLCCPRGFFFFFFLSAFRSIRKVCLQVDHCSVAGLGWELGFLGGSPE